MNDYDCVTNAFIRLKRSLGRDLNLAIHFIRYKLETYESMLVLLLREA